MENGPTTDYYLKSVNAGERHWSLDRASEKVQMTRNGFAVKLSCQDQN